MLAAAPDAIVAGADDAVRPAWLDEWLAWRDLPAVARGNLFVVDANLLHRSGPRFVDGVEQICKVLAAARANRSAQEPLMRVANPLAASRCPIICLASARHASG